MCNTRKCSQENYRGDCMMDPFDPTKCPISFIEDKYDGDIGDIDIPEENKDGEAA